MWLLLVLKPINNAVGHWSLACLSLLACFEKLSSIMNLVSVERDWVVVIAGKDQESLRKMNSQMRRIDLVCKLLGPFMIGVVDGFSTRRAVEVNLAISVASVAVEYFAIKQVYPSEGVDSTSADYHRSITWSLHSEHPNRLPVCVNRTAAIILGHHAYNACVLRSSTPRALSECTSDTEHFVHPCLVHCCT